MRGVLSYDQRQCLVPLRVGASVVSEPRGDDRGQVGRFQVVERLAGDGLGPVFEAASPAGQRVALRVIAPPLADNPRVLERFGQELRIAVAITSPFITRIVDADLSGPKPWIAAELIPGPTLERLVTTQGPLGVPRLLALAAALASGLRDIHQACLSHRDLNPSKVILAADRPRITDLGIAVSAREALASTGSLLGMPAYLSPEQAALAEVAAPSDIFSLGSVLTFAATGRGPFGGGGDLLELLRRIADGDPDLTGAPRGICPLIGACLAKRPASRPSASELLDEIHAIAAREIGLGAAGLEGLMPGIASGHQDPMPVPAAGDSRNGSPAGKPKPLAAPPPTGAYRPAGGSYQQVPLAASPAAGGGSHAPGVASWTAADWYGAAPATAPQAPAGYGAAPVTASKAADGEYSVPAAADYGPPGYPGPAAAYPAPAAAPPTPLGLATLAQSAPLAEPPGPRALACAAPSQPGSGDDPADSRFLTGIIPERAPLGARISLLVQVTRASVRGTSVPLKDFLVPPGGARVTITVSAPGLFPLGDLEQDVAVPSAGDSEIVRFGFMAGYAGLHSVDVRAFVDGTCRGELGLQVSVETGATLEMGRLRTAVMSKLAAEPGEVTLQVSRTAGGGYSFQLLSEALYPVVLIDRLAGDPARVVEKITAELRQMSKGQSPYASPVHARNRLRSLGSELWADVVPDEIRRQFWAQRDRIELFTIASDMDTVPWELIYPVDLYNEDGFLVEQFPVVRRVYGQGRPRSLRLDAGAGYVVPPRSPTNALDEVNAVRGILPANVPDRGIQAGLAEVFELLEAMPSVLHFAGHNAFTEEAGSVISLSGGPLRPEDLSYARQKRAFEAVSPLVFLNGCRTAGQIAGFAQMNGWAEKFVGAGAAAFIGSLWAVRSESAKTFAEEFYHQLVRESQPLGIASLRARQAIAADAGDPTWLAYTVYGNPSASVDSKPPSVP